MPLRLFLPSGSMRNILPKAEPRFCARFIGSPPLPPSAMPIYISPKSAEPGRANGLKREHAAVVIGEGLAQPEQLSRRGAVIGRGGGRFGRPFEQHGVVRGLRAWRREIGRGRLIRRVREGVELAESWRAGLCELRMKDDALHAALASLRLHRVTPLRIVGVKVRRHRLAIGAHDIERAAHVADEQASRCRLLDKRHHARGDAVDVRQRRELAERDGNHTLGAGDRLRKRLVRLSGGEWGRWRALPLCRRIRSCDENERAERDGEDDAREHETSWSTHLSASLYRRRRSVTGVASALIPAVRHAVAVVGIVSPCAGGSSHQFIQTGGILGRELLKLRLVETLGVLHLRLRDVRAQRGVSGVRLHVADWDEKVFMNKPPGANDDMARPLIAHVDDEAFNFSEGLSVRSDHRHAIKSGGSPIELAGIDVLQLWSRMVHIAPPMYAIWP